jgi:SAM-dependent methyltransferase
VIGIDLAPGALKTAEERARKRGLTNIRFQHADAHDLPFANESFDRITSRLGVMFLADLPRALREMHRVLKPGGRLALLTWGPMKQPYFESTVGTVLRMLPGGVMRESDLAMFAFAVPGILAQKLQQAGFAQVEENFVTLPWTWPGTPQECWDYFQEVTAPFATLFRSIPQDERPAIDAEVLQAISKYYNGHEINFTATANICCASK